MSTLRKLLVIAVLAGLVAACVGSPSESPGGPGTNGGQAPKLTGAADGAGTVTVAVPSSDPGDINLASAWPGVHAKTPNQGEAAGHPGHQLRPEGHHHDRRWQAGGRVRLGRRADPQHRQKRYALDLKR